MRTNPLCYEDIFETCAKLEYFKGNTYEQAYQNILQTRRNPRFNSDKLTSYKRIIKDLYPGFIEKELKYLEKLKRLRWYLNHIKRVLTILGQNIDEKYEKRFGQLKIPIVSIKVTISHLKITIRVTTCYQDYFDLQYIPKSKDNCFKDGCVVWSYWDVTEYREPWFSMVDNSINDFTHRAVKDFLIFTKILKVTYKDVEFDIGRYNGFPENNSYYPDITFYKLLHANLEESKTKINTRGFNFKLRYYHQNVLFSMIDMLRSMQPGTLETLSFRIMEDNVFQTMGVCPYQKMEEQWDNAKYLDISDGKITKNWDIYNHFEIVKVDEMDTPEILRMLKMINPENKNKTCRITVVKPLDFEKISKDFKHFQITDDPPKFYYRDEGKELGMAIGPYFLMVENDREL